MDQFESILGTLLRAKGYWVCHSCKVNLTTEEKSYFDSGGVSLSSLQDVHDVPKGRYKLFTSERYRNIVFRGLLRQLTENGMANSNTSIELGLAAGRIYGNQTDLGAEFMASKGWTFWSPMVVEEKMQALAQKGYENDAAIMTAKILLN